MVKNEEKQRGGTHTEQHRERKIGRVIIMFIILLSFLCVILVMESISAASFDNTKSFDKNVGDYGKVTIKDWFGLLDLAELELKTNTDECLIFCNATKEIIMYQDGILIDDVKFETILKDNSRIEEPIEDYKFSYKVNGKWRTYKLGTEVKSGTYQVKLEGKKSMLKTVDWIIKSQGIWIGDWIIWNTNQPVAYFEFDESSGTSLANSVNASFNGTLNNMNNNDWVPGILSNALIFDGNNDFVNITGGVGTGDNWASSLNIINDTSISFWINITNQTDDNEAYVAIGKVGAGTRGFGNPQALSFQQIGFGECATDPNLISKNTWYHIVMTQETGRVNTTNTNLYVNGTEYPIVACSAGFKNLLGNFYIGFSGTAIFMNATIDELGIWDNVLSQAEITELYNSGLGLEYSEQTSLRVELNFPSNNTNVSTAGTYFDANYTMDDNQDLKNATYNIWYSNGTLFNQTLEIVTGTTTNTTSLFVDLGVVDDYHWNVLACSENTTTGVCNWQTDGNFTIGAINMYEVSQIFNVNSTEGNTETFLINISYDVTDFPNIQGTLVYNNTRFSSTNVNSDIYYVFSSTAIAPAVSADMNIPFYWEFILNNGTDLTINSTMQNQTVSDIGIDDCGTHSTLIINATLKDEKNQSKIDGTSYNTIVNVDVDIRATSGTETLIAFSQNYTKLSNVQVCLSDDLSNSSYDMYVQIQYEADSYAKEFYNIQNLTITNQTTTTIPIQINLFDLLDADSQTFLITFKDEDFLPVEDALVDIQRKYVDEGVFKTVEIPKTDVNGQTTGHFELEGTIYTMIISKNGEILAIFNNTAVVCQDQIIGDCRLNLNAFSTTTDFTDWRTEGGITYDMSFDESARTITTTFSTTNGGTKTILLNVTKYDRFSNTTICFDTLTSSSGTLTCNIPASFGNVTLEARLFSDGNFITRRIYRITPDAGDYFGAANAGIMILIMIITIPLMLTTSTIGVVLGIIAGLVMAVLLNLYTGGSLIGMTSAIMWLIIAAGIIIWKIAKRGGG